MLKSLPYQGMVLAVAVEFGGVSRSQAWLIGRVVRNEGIWRKKSRHVRDSRRSRGMFVTAMWSGSCAHVLHR
jgi:hypothetical protein